MEPDYRDFATSRDYCHHGSYVGCWAGPDFMCGYCEDGISDADYDAMVERRLVVDRRVYALRHQLARRLEQVNADPTNERLVGRLVWLMLRGVKLPHRA